MLSCHHHIGRPTRYLFNMDMIEKSRILHPSMMIRAYGKPKLVDGIANQAVYLNGEGQYLDFGEHGESCLGNLRYCKHGITGSLWAKFPQFYPGMHYISTGLNGINIFYDKSALKVTANIPEKQWDLEMPPLTLDEWNFIEFSWHPKDGLKVYLNKDLVGNATAPKKVPKHQDKGVSHLYVGRPNRNFPVNTNSTYGHFTIDDFDIWQGRREDLIAFNYINRGMCIPSANLPNHSGFSEIIKSIGHVIQP